MIKELETIRALENYRDVRNFTINQRVRGAEGVPALTAFEPNF